MDDQVDGVPPSRNCPPRVVRRGRPWTPEEQQYLVYLALGGFPVFMRDPILVVDKHVIELAAKTPFRRKEIFSVRELLERRVAQDPQADYVSMRPPLPAKPTRMSDGPGPFLKGGDIFVMGKDVLVWKSGMASDQAGIEWLQRYLGPDGYRVHEVPLTENWLHLDCIFAVVRRGLCICDTSGLEHGLPSILKDWEVIPATSEEAHAHTRLIRELEMREATVVSGFRMDIASQWGGGIRCASHPLLRDV
ncbi:arginine deiminase family protein [Streptomyces sp. NPDC048550]|uniref:arginine deiminase family protein n=1 Tax=Streptomyces sp. NPDC048550 TaxID=3155739 RepID=UPI00342FFBC9